MIAKGRFVKGNRREAGKCLSGHFKYMEHRTRTEQETRQDRHIFSEDSDDVKRSEAIDGIMDNTSSSVNYHKIVLSPGQDEPVADWREWTREVMHDLEEHQGKDLHWYAVFHNNTDNPHVHVVVAGAGEDLETGQTEAVKLYPQDYQFIRESGREHSDYEHYRFIRETAQDLDTQDTVGRETLVQFQEREFQLDSAQHGLEGLER
jgi:relaxase-like protein